MKKTDRANVLRDIRQTHRGWFAQCAEAAGGRVAPFEEVHVTYNPQGLGSVSIAFPRIKTECTGPVLDEIIDWCLTQGPWSIIGCWSGGRPPRALSAALLARGFDWAWEPHWMAVSHDDLPPIRPPQGVEIVVDPPASFWEKYPHPYYGVSDPTTAQERVALLTKAQALADGTGAFRIRHTVAVADGRPIGAAVTFQTGKVAGVFDVGVLPSERNRGIGTAVTCAALHTAHQDGCARSVLNATPLGEAVYRKLGFRSADRGQTFWLHRKVIAKGLPDRDLVRFVEALGAQDIGALERLLPALEVDGDTVERPLACGLRPIEVAAKLRAYRSTQWLMNRGAVLDVMTACDLGWRERVPDILRESPEVINFRKGPEQATALHFAAAFGDEQLVQWLLAAGADTTIRDHIHDSTPAGWARHFGRNALAERIDSSP